MEAGRRFVTTLRYLNASEGEFRYEDHGSNWSVDLPDMDFSIAKVLDYRGHAASAGGVLRIADFEPMWIDLDTDFLIDGADVDLTRIDLLTDGATTRLEGDVDLSNFPEMSYTLESDIDLARMREIFFAGRRLHRRRLLALQRHVPQVRGRARPAGDRSPATRRASTRCASRT